MVIEVRSRRWGSESSRRCGEGLYGEIGEKSLKLHVCGVSGKVIAEVGEDEMIRNGPLTIGSAIDCADHESSQEP